MKTISALIVVCVFSFCFSTAFSWDMLWYNDLQLFKPNGMTPLPPGCMVQLIADGGKDGVDDPYEWWMSQPDPNAAMQSWIAGGCLPIGDDYLVISSDPIEQNPTYIKDFTFDPGYDPQIYDGYFYATYISSSDPAYGSGTGLYTRFFTAQNPEYGDFYGTVGTEEMGQPFNMYQLDNPIFPTYAVHGGIASQQIVVPEPAIISIFSGTFFLTSVCFMQRKRKRNK